MQLKNSAFLSHGSLVLGHCHIICSTGVLNLPYEPKVLPNQVLEHLLPQSLTKERVSSVYSM